MTRKQRRLWVVSGAGVLLVIAAALTMLAFGDKATFFYSPSDIAEKPVEPGQRIRLGGLVADGSVNTGGGDGLVRFVVTDGAETVRVSYRGILPDLFREGQGVVTEGAMDRDGTFVASDVLAKHDETYMPREVADALKKSGQWQGGAQGGTQRRAAGGDAAR